MRTRSSSRTRLAPAVAAAAVLLALAGPAAAGDGARDKPLDATQGVVDVDFVQFHSVTGVDHVANGGGTRNEGHTTIELRGVPPGSLAVDATLYFGLILDQIPQTVDVNFEGHRVTGTLLGVSAEPCWNPNGRYALYAARVLPFIPPWINGDYQTDGYPSLRTDGGDPWVVVGNGLPLAEGATLVILYRGQNTGGAITWIHFGPATFIGGGLNVNHGLAPAMPVHTSLKHTRIGADGQKGFSNTPVFGLAADTTAVNGIQFKGPGAPDNQDSDWNGDDGVPLNQLWDTHTTDISRIRGIDPIPAGAANYVINYFSPTDCVSPSVHILTAQ